MKSNTEGSIEALRDAFLRYGIAHPQRVRRHVRGERIIEQGAISDVCYVIRSGTVIILFSDNTTGEEKEIALRYAPELVGETAFLQRGLRRTASVVVYSDDAELVSITTSDFYAILAQKPELGEAAATLLNLNTTRQRETSAVLGGKLSIQAEIMSALLADIHNFSGLSEVVLDEEIDSFLFEFVELSSDTAQKYSGTFEDQGDGFKILFNGPAHAPRAVKCAIEVLRLFRSLREGRETDNVAFRKIGLGIGICTKGMVIRKREGSSSATGRVVSHALNVAAAMSKYRESVNEIEVYVDRETMEHACGHALNFGVAEEIPLEKLGRRQIVHRVTSTSGVEPPIAFVPAVGSAFVSYSHADSDFVDKLVGRLQRDGVAIWRDTTHISVGDDITRSVSQGIQGNRLFLLILTPNSIHSQWVDAEIDWVSQDAVNGAKVLLPVLAGGVSENELDPRIRGKKTISFAADFERPYSILLDSIRKHTRAVQVEN